MKKINSILRYLILNYPNKSDLSKTRVTKMVYLADWYFAKQYNKQMTNIDWFFDHYGPYVPDVFQIAKSDEVLEIIKDTSLYGAPKSLISLKEGKSVPYNLSEREKSVIDQVIEDTKYLTWNSFIRMVYDTEPIKYGKRYETLDLVKYAQTAN